MKFANLLLRLISLFLFFVAGTVGAQMPSAPFDPLPFVNPFIGADAHGHTFPGATLPFGMVQLSPDTRLEGWDGCSGYHYSDNHIYGFSHTHLSGTGVPDYCDVLLMPFAWQNPPTRSEQYRSGFDKKNEQAEPGYYRVLLDAGSILTELTATARVGIHRYTFPKSTGSAGLLLDLRHRDAYTGTKIDVQSKNLVTGYRFSTAWAGNQRVFFAIRFSSPFQTVETADSTQAVFRFEAAGDAPLVVTVGLSSADVEGALKNLDAEAQHFDFDRYRTQARTAWQKALSRVEVSGGSAAQMRVFYTALYHTLLAPNLFSDVDGRYRGHDGRVHRAQNHDVYTVFSLWDTYRACKPLYSLLEPERLEAFIQTFLLQYDQSGLLPVWELAGNETNCMIGYHSVPVMADAWKKDLRAFDGERALTAMTRSAGQNKWGQTPYRTQGYIPVDAEGESVSKTLEYAYDDWCIAEMAHMLGRDSIRKTYLRRAQHWKNLFNPQTGFFQGKSNATWQTPFDPYEVNFNYTEANAWQYRFAVPQDVNTLMDWMGGHEAFAGELDKLFSANTQTTGRDQADITGLIGQYAHGNEPSHHMAYLYNFAGQPWKTQLYVRRIMDELYSDRPDGLCGNEDVGQMSAWLVFSAMGFYPVTPVSNTYVIGTPWFESLILHLNGGKKLSISAPGVSKKRFYVGKLLLNGEEYPKSYLTHEMVADGGHLQFEMTDKPGAWAVEPKDCPRQRIGEQLIVPVPFVQEGKRVFRKNQTIALGCADTAAQIWYTLDGQKPLPGACRQYTAPFAIDADTQLRMLAVRGQESSAEAQAVFSLIRNNLNVMRYQTPYTNPYTGGGAEGLVDQIRGGADYRSGAWQGFQGADMDVIIDLGAEKPVKQVSAGFLQDENAWIFFPKSLKVEISTDGKQFEPVGSRNNVVPPVESGALLQEMKIKFEAKNARYVRVFAESLIVCPQWHKGAGEPCWVFTDEITVE